MGKKTMIEIKSKQLALSIIDVYKQLIELKKEFILSRKLVRSGTAIGALVREANNAESGNYFIHKLSIE